MAVQYSPGAVTTDTGSVSSDTAAFEQTAYFALRSQPMFDSCADVRSTNQSHNGASVQFNIYNDLDRNTTALTEDTDVTPVVIGDSTVVVTLAEQGNAVVTTAKLRGTSFLNVDADAANIIGYNMVDSIDAIAHDVLVGGSNVIYSAVEDASVGRTNVDDGDIISAALARQAVAKLRAGNSNPYAGGQYKGFLHPDVSYDLRSDTAVTDIIQYQIRQAGGNVAAGSVGSFLGVDWYETPRLGKGVDTTAGTWVNASDGAGSTGNVDVYPTLILGQQGLAKAVSRAPGFGENPSIVFGPVTDTLMRFQPVGWYHLVGYKRFREASIYRIESASSIGDNAS